MLTQGISVDPAIMVGVPCVAGTRIPVSVVLDCLGAGMAEPEIVREYPSLTYEGVRAACRYGAGLARLASGFRYEDS